MKFPNYKSRRGVKTARTVEGGRIVGVGRIADIGSPDYDKPYWLLDCTKCDAAAEAYSPEDAKLWIRKHNREYHPKSERPFTRDIEITERLGQGGISDEYSERKVGL